MLSNIFDHGSVLYRVIDILRYDLLKALAFILIFAAAVIYTQSESEKYYLKDNHNKERSL